MFELSPLCAAKRTCNITWKLHSAGMILEQSEGSHSTAPATPVPSESKAVVLSKPLVTPPLQRL
jgi:hypothetical protein